MATSRFMTPEPVRNTGFVNAPTRDQIVTAAHAWLGTPYHHQMSLRGVGTDCLGLVRGIWRELYGTEPQAMPAYSRDWAEASGSETLLDTARLHFAEIDPRSAASGDVLIFRYRAGFVAKHAGVLTAPRKFLHACEGGPVCEIALTPWWSRRIAAAFAFPHIQP